MYKNKIIKFILPAFMIILFMGYGCKKDDTNEDNAHLEVFLTDDPGVYDAVNVNVQSVDINANGQWHSYTVVHPGMYNLLQFASGIDTLLISEDISPMTVTQIRLVLGDGNNVVVDGVTYPLETPSAETSGLKINVNYTFEAGIAYKLWLDFDAEQSIVQQGTGDYSLKPVIRAYTEVESGAISGHIMPITGSYYVQAIQGTDTAGTYITGDGSFLIGGLTQGSYDVTFFPNVGFLSITITGVMVETGIVTDMGTITIPI